MKEEELNVLLGKGPEVSVSIDDKKTLRIGTVKQLQEIGELYSDNLLKLKYVIYKKDEEQINKWIEILSIIFIEGFTREELDNSIPELLESAVDEFLFG